MPSKELKYVLIGQDQSASKTFDKAAAHGQSSAAKIGSSFSKAGAQIGGEFGDVLMRTGDGLDKLGEKGLTTGQKLQALGGLAVGAGALLSVMGAKETQATNALDQSITNSGHHMADYADEIERTVKHMEHYGSTAVETKNALTQLTDATHDPAKALQLMQTSADLAAASHTSLADAAGKVAKAYNGAGRLFKQYGIVVKQNADGTKDYSGAVAALGTELAGRANASSTTFLGTLHRLRAEVTDGAAAWGQKYGPALTAAAAATMILGPLVVGAKNKLVAYRTATREAALATDELTASQGRSKLAMAGGTAGIAGIAAATYLGGKAISNWAEKNDSFVKTMNTVGSALDQLHVAMLNAPADAQATGKAWVEAQLQGDGLATKAAKAGITLDQMTTAVMGGADSTKQLVAQWKASGDPAQNTIVALALLATGYNGVVNKTKDATDGTGQFGDTQGKAAAEALSLDAALKYQNDQFDKLNNRYLTAEKAVIAFKDSEDKLAASFKANGKSLVDNTAKGRANLTAVFDSIDAAQKHSDAVLRQTGSTEKATAAYQADIESLRRHLAALGLEPKAIQEIINKYAKVPALKKTKVDLKDDASARIAALNARLHALTDPRWTVSVGVGDPVFSFKSGPVKATAGGSDFFEGGRTLVAEREQEIIAPRGASITPLSKLRGGSGGDIHLTVNFAMPLVGGPTPPAVARALVAALTDARRYGYTGG